MTATLATPQSDVSERVEATTDLAGRITSLRYDRLVNLGNYENEKLSASIAVPEGEDPDAALAALKDWVTGRVGMVEAARSIEYRLQSATRRLSETNGTLAAMKERWKTYRAFLLAQGVPEAELPREPYWGATVDAEAAALDADPGYGADDDEDDDRE